VSHSHGPLAGNATSMSAEKEEVRHPHKGPSINDVMGLGGGVIKDDNSAKALLLTSVIMGGRGCQKLSKTA
jgi:hypothetical protein